MGSKASPHLQAREHFATLSSSSSNIGFCSRTFGITMVKSFRHEILPFKNKSKLEDIVVVYFCDLDDVDDWHGDIDVDRDVDVVHFVKAEGSNLLVVVVLGFSEGLEKISNQQEFGENREWALTFIERSLQLSSSDSSRQLEVWSHLGWTRSLD